MANIITPAAYFSNYDEGTGYVSWVNPAQAISANIDVGSVSLLASERSNRLSLTNWTEAPLQSNIRVLNIQLETMITYAGAAGNPQLRVAMSPIGATRTRTINTATDQIYTFSGDLTYWALTNSEAIQAINTTSGTSGPFITINNNTAVTTNSINVTWFRMTVTYKPSTGGILLGNF